MLLFVRLASSKPGQKMTHPENLYFPKGAQIKQVIVTADDYMCASAHGQFQKFIIFGISTYRNLFNWFNKYCPPNQRLEKFFTLLGSHISLKLLTAHHLVYFL